MRRVTSSFTENDSEQEKLSAQMKVLNEQIRVQKQRVDLLDQGLRESSQKYGDSATQTLKWRQALNDAKTSLNNMEHSLDSTDDGPEMALQQKFTRRPMSRIWTAMVCALQILKLPRIFK